MFLFTSSMAYYEKISVLKSCIEGALLLILCTVLVCMYEGCKILERRSNVDSNPNKS